MKEMYKKSVDAKRRESSHAANKSMHASANEHVKRVQEEQARYAGKEPRMRADCGNYNAEMYNTGENAQRFTDELTRGLDKTAFPVREG